MKATDKQVDGTHYNKLKIQPIQLAYSLNATPCFCKLAKYITRNKDDMVIQLNKAAHCIELERELIDGNNFYGTEYDDWGIEAIAPHEKIKEFSLQFDQPNAIYNALFSMFNGEYDNALIEVKFLKERLQ